MTMTTQLPKAVSDAVMRAVTGSCRQLVHLSKNRVIRGAVVREVERRMLEYLKESRSYPSRLPGVEDDRVALGLAIVGTIERALAEGLLSDEYVQSLLRTLVQVLFLKQGSNEEIVKRFEA